MYRQIMMIIVLLTITMLFWGCSSMGFIPPKYSLATTDYVNSSVARQQHSMQKELITETQAMLDSLTLKQNVRLEEIEKKVKSQSNDIFQVSDKADRLLGRLESLQSQLKKIEGNLSDVESTVSDSIAKIVEFTTDLKSSMSGVRGDLEALSQANTEIEELSRNLRSRMDRVPEESLLKLQTILQEALSE